MATGGMGVATGGMGWQLVAWGGNCPPEQHDASFLPPMETFLPYFIVAFSLQQGEVS